MHFYVSSAICFNLDQSKILSFGNGLTPYHTRKILDQSKFQALSDNKINMTDKFEFVFGIVGKHFGERRKYLLPAYSPFRKMFSKASFYSRHIKTWACLRKG